MRQPALRFLHAHATHPHPELALELAWAQLASQGAASMGATLGWCYLTDALSGGAQAVLDGLRQRLPHVNWVGAVGAGVLATGVEYMDEPALALMVCNLPAASFRLFHGRQALPPLAQPSHTNAPQARPWQAHSAQVHADAHTADLGELIHELAARTDTGYLFGGLSIGRRQGPHLAAEARPTSDTASPSSAEGGLWHGGLSGVAFDAGVHLVSRVTQGCAPVGPRREVTASERNIVYELDGEPALNCLLADLGVVTATTAVGWQREALPKVRATLVGLSDADSELMSHGHHFGSDTRVRHLIGLDASRQGVALSDLVEPGMQLAFCQRHAQAARQDLVRICAEIREEFDPSEHPHRHMAGAIYISCSGRGGDHFGAPNAELAIIAHALGDVPLVGFFAGGEIARQHLYGYTGVLTVFGTDTAPPPSH